MILIKRHILIIVTPFLHYLLERTVLMLLFSSLFLLLQGFTDQSMNIQILVKNKGSIKRAVKDLVNLEKL